MALGRVRPHMCKVSIMFGDSLIQNLRTKNRPWRGSNPESMENR